VLYYNCNTLHCEIAGSSEIFVHTISFNNPKYATFVLRTVFLITIPLCHRIVFCIIPKQWNVNNLKTLQDFGIGILDLVGVFQNYQIDHKICNRFQ
jgi:hypothetical protein